MAYTGVFVFGDSLVDSGNALKLAEWYGDLTFSDLPEGAPTAEDGYYQGRFSNGFTFADLISNKIVGLVTKPVFPFGFEDPWLGVPVDPFAGDPSGNNLNFAYGGAQIRNGDEVVPDLDGQTDAFKDAIDNDPDPGALYLVTIGGNDVRSLVPSGGTPASLATAQSALNKCADQLINELGQLIALGVENILIMGIPDVGLIPKYDRDGNGVLEGEELSRSQAATQYSQILDSQIRTKVIPALEAKGATITYVPLMDYVDAKGMVVTGALNAILPTLAALHGLAADELTDNMLKHQQLIFFDQVHPNAQANALLGAYTYARLNGTPWIETMPLAAATIDYQLNTSIGAAGEVDRLTFSLVAGTTYTLEMLGLSSLGIPGNLADPALRMIGSSGTVVAANADDGVGFDSVLTFTPTTSGNYTLELSATGQLTGGYTVQAAVLSGAATQAGNSYTVSSASTIILEGAGGVGQDVIRTSVSYALGALSEIEVLRTTNDRGKAALNLTGNDFAQTIVGNAVANVIEGRGGADVMTGLGGADTFVLSASALSGSANVDTITDYSSADLIDVGQVLKVASGTNVVSGGYLRVTSSGLVQVDLDGGGNGWMTLATIGSGSGSVNLRYSSGGVATNVTVSRTSDGASASSAMSYEPLHARHSGDDLLGL